MTDLFDTPPQTTAPTFDEFWAIYPRKVGKGAARKAYAKALKVARHDDIMWGLSQQIDGMKAKEKQFIPHASTWLNEERWDDEPEQPNSVARSTPANGNATVEQIHDAARVRRSSLEDLF